MALRYCTKCGRGGSGDRCAFCGTPLLPSGGAYWTGRDLLVALLTAYGALTLLFGALVTVPLSGSVSFHTLAFGSAVSGDMFALLASYSAETGAMLLLYKIVGCLLYATIAASVAGLFRKIDSITSVLRWISMLVGAVLFTGVLYARNQLSQSLYAAFTGMVRLTPGVGFAALVAAIALERARGALPRVVYHLANGQPAHAPRPAAVPSMRGSLVCTRGAFAGARFDLSGSPAVAIGRSARDSQIVLPQGETLISRRHVLVQFNPSENCYYITDYSRNGTFFSGGTRAPAGQPCRVSRGTPIYLDKHGRNAFLLE